MKGLRTRATSAIIFVALILGGLMGGPYSFLTLFTVVTAICLGEFFLMVMDRYKRRDRMRIGLGIAFGLVPHLIASAMLLDWLPDEGDLMLAVVLVFFALLFLMFIYELLAESRYPFENVAMMVTGMVYIGAPFAMLDFIAYHRGEFNATLVFGVLAMTWLSDTGAYLTGSNFGKTPLLTRISPNKTWEGLVGGIALVLASSQVLAYFFPLMSTLDWFWIALIVAVFGPIGDLVESMLKRSLHVKDSGKVLPGHGGLLDRFDAFIFLLPFVAAYLIFAR